MRNNKRVLLTLLERRNELKQMMLEERTQHDPNATLTTADRQAVDDLIHNTILNEWVGEKPLVDPAKLNDMIRQKIPDFPIPTQEEVAKRQEKRNRAAAAYADGMMNATRYQEGMGDFTRERWYERVCMFFTDEERRSFAEHYQKIKTSYYTPELNMTPEAVQDAIAENQREIDRLAAGAVMRMVDEYEQILTHDMSDDELIERYPSLTVAINLTQEAISLLNKAVKVFPAEQIESYKRRASAMMDRATAFDKRMSVMADPYYGVVKLEALNQALPSQLDDLTTSLMVGDEAFEEAGIELTDEQRDNLENFRAIPGDISMMQNLLLPGHVAAKQGFDSIKDWNKNCVICTSDGTICSGSFLELIEKHSQLYSINVNGQTAPVPIMLDSLHGSFQPVTGKDDIRNIEIPEMPQPRPLGMFSRIANWFSETFGGGPTDTMQEYQRSVREWEKIQQLANAKDRILNQPLPEGVQATLSQLNTVANLQPKCERNLQNTLTALQHVQPTPGTSAYHNIIASLLVDRSFLAAPNSKLRQITHSIINPFSSNFDLDRSRAKLGKFEAFQEFADQIAEKKPGLLRDLQGGNPRKIDEALAALEMDFADHFRGENPSGKQPSEAYKAVLSARAADRTHAITLPGDDQIYNPAHMKSSEECIDNKFLWDSIFAIYGAERKLRLDMTQFGAHRVYNVDSWQQMQKSKVDLNLLTPENTPISEKTFASLNMLLCLRPVNAIRSSDGKILPDTVPFEDIVLGSNDFYPRNSTDSFLSTLIEPTRSALVSDLSHMNEPIPGTDPSITGKEHLCKELADKLKIYADRVSTFSWMDRSFSVLTEVCEACLSFAEEHDMMQLLKDNGLAEKELEDIQIARAFGKITNDAYNAELALAKDADGSAPLTAEQKLECINKMALLKTIQADVKNQTVETNFAPPPVREDGESAESYKARMDEWYAKSADTPPRQFSETAKDLIYGGTALQSLSERILPMDERQKLVSGSAKDIRDKVGCHSLPSLTSWTEYLKAHKAEEGRLCMELRHNRELQNNITKKLDAQNGNANHLKNAEQVEKAMKNAQLSSNKTQPEQHVPAQKPTAEQSISPAHII